MVCQSSQIDAPYMTIVPRTSLLSAAKTVFTIVMLAASALTVASASPPPIDLTPIEQAYIEKVGTVKMCVDPDWAPFERINPQGQHEGIAADLVQLVALRAGLKIELHSVKDWDESLAASKGKRCQIMSFLNQTPARDAGLIFTAPIFSDPNVIIAREEHGYIADLKGLQGERVALPHGTMVEERVRRDFPNLQVVLTTSEPEAGVLPDVQFAVDALAVAEKICVELA